MRAIFAIDGGNATGLAWGIFDDKAKSVEEAIKGRLHAGSMTLNRRVKRNGQWHYEHRRTEDLHSFDPGEVEKLLAIVEPKALGDMEQIIAIYVTWFRFKRFVVRHCLLDPEDVELIIEDFILLPGPHAGGRDGVASVRIAWGVAGYQEGVAAEYRRRHHQLHISEPIWQTPGAQGRVKDAHLKQYGVWIPGREHERSAWKHIAYRLNKLLK